jgi:choline dehydrogenase-like flavoprotein
LPFFKKHQTLDPNTSNLLDPTFMPDAGKEKYHGSKGPIHTSFNNYYMPLEEDFVKAAYETTGTTNTLTDAWGGDHLGFFSSLAVVDRTKGVGQRSYSANGYLNPNLHRPNLKVLTEALASKLILEQGMAKGVEFIHDGNHHQVSTNREVVLCLGTVQTPQLLELSGIGDPKILDKIGVPCQIESPRVGANFQDHVLTGVTYELAPGIISMDSLIDPEVAKQQREIYTSTQGGMYGNPGMLMGFLSYASLVNQKELQATIDQIRAASLAETEFSKAQEEVGLRQTPWKELSLLTMPPI